ncbi:Protein of unknown function [Sphingomonas gellani]|uniref:DUF1453 domain-containing protein n=1 Tax=Sphingomonas gellani TaxID=1166340 RepID=A0A1H7YXZ0_9SPHN|nr:CcdC protein domain-containing protein [Sphingomonas gellani]SEM50137.1 Protein of unknown function [Sphingomonas gellani]
MHVQTVQPGGWVQYAITAAVIAVVLALRWRRLSRVTPLRLERLWVLPAVYGAVAIALFATHPPVGLAWLFCAIAAALGAALGWQRGKTMRITVDPETHALNQSGSPAAILFIVLLIVVRMGARAMMTTSNGLHLDALAVTDMLVALAVGLFAAQRIEMYLRATRLLEVARTARA